MKEAVAPMAMSPYPAGSANIAGRTPYACNRTSTSPRILEDCIYVKVRGFKYDPNCRNPSEVTNHSENRAIGSGPLRSQIPEYQALALMTLRDCGPDRILVNQRVWLSRLWSGGRFKSSRAHHDDRSTA
jgi:hypothetical protein